MSSPELYKKLIDIDDEDVEIRETYAKAIPVAPRAAPRVPCWCKCILITIAIFVAMSLLAFAMTYMWMKDVVRHLTVTTPHERFPVVSMTDAELAVVKDRMTLFVDELSAGVPTTSPELVITQDELNGFLGHSDYLRGNMFITLDKNFIKEEYSLPTDMIPGGKGRFFVGSEHVSIDPAAGQLEVESETAAKHMDWFDGPLLFAQLQYIVTNHDDESTMLELYLEKGSFFGQEAPQDFIDEHKNLLEEFYTDPDTEDARAIVEGIESVSIEPGKIVIKPRHHVVPYTNRALRNGNNKIA